jgi:hypothetical protein
LSQEQVPSLHIQHLPNRLRFTLQQKIARAAQKLKIKIFTAEQKRNIFFIKTLDSFLLKPQ